MDRRIYLDNNSTTPVLPEVVAAMQPFWADSFGNASAVHTHGRTAREAIDLAREQLASLLGARPAEITFTASGTESDNHALFGTLAPGDHCITTSIEHHAVLHAAQELERRGVALTVVDPDRNGVVQPGTVQAALQPNTRLVSLMLANNETGVLQPIAEVARIVHANIVTSIGDAAPSKPQTTLLHTDAVQAVGKLPVRVADLGCDLLSLSAHKLHATQGVGALWTRRGLAPRPLLFGGPHERQRRAGTENVPGIVALGRAAALAAAWLPDGLPALARLHHGFETALIERIPGAIIHGTGVARLPNTTSVRFPGIDAEALVIALDLQGLSISGGSACTSGAVEPSHVLRAMGLTDAEARSTVRISLSRLTTQHDLTRALDLLATTVARLRALA